MVFPVARWDRVGKPAYGGGTSLASGGLAKAIAFAMRIGFSLSGRASKARPAPAPPSAGASRPQGVMRDQKRASGTFPRRTPRPWRGRVALASWGLSWTGLLLTGHTRMGKRGAFPDPPGPALPDPLPAPTPRFAARCAWRRPGRFPPAARGTDPRPAG